MLPQEIIGDGGFRQTEARQVNLSQKLKDPEACQGYIWLPQSTLFFSL